MIVKSKAVYFFIGLAIFLSLVILANANGLQNGRTLSFVFYDLEEYSYLGLFYFVIMLFFSGVKIRSYILTDDDLKKAQQTFSSVKEKK